MNPNDRLFLLPRGGHEPARYTACADEAFLEGFRRFGLVKMMLKEIRDPDPPDFVSLVDIDHPSVQKLD